MLKFTPLMVVKIWSFCQNEMNRNDKKRERGQGREEEEEGERRKEKGGDGRGGSEGLRGQSLCS